MANYADSFFLDIEEQRFITINNYSQFHDYVDRYYDRSLDDIEATH